MSQQKDIELLKKIASRLKEIRHKKKLSQLDVYHETNINIARIELASLNISVSTLNSLCKFYEISLTDFFNGI